MRGEEKKNCGGKAVKEACCLRGSHGGRVLVTGPRVSDTRTPWCGGSNRPTFLAVAGGGGGSNRPTSPLTPFVPHRKYSLVKKKLTLGCDIS